MTKRPRGVFLGFGVMKRKNLLNPIQIKVLGQPPVKKINLYNFLTAFKVVYKSSILMFFHLLWRNPGFCAMMTEKLSIG